MNKNTFEKFFSKFVGDFGGEVLPEVHTVPSADFLFRSDLVISELKTLEEDKTSEHAKKLQALAWDWQRRGLLVAFGRVKISLPDLSEQCQREWLKILEPPIERLIRDANKQIRSTKEHMNLQGNKGLLLIANDGNFLHTDPKNFMILVSRVLRKKKDGKPRFPNIDGVCYFSYRVRTQAEGMPFWVSGVVAENDPAMSAFQRKLNTAWLAYLSKITKQPIAEIRKDAIDQNRLTLVRVEINSRIEEGKHVVSAQVFCRKDNCGKPINLVSNGPNTRQWVQCPIHGVIGSFQNLDDYQKTIREVINRNAVARGLAGIEPDAQVRVIEGEQDVI